MAVVSLSNEVFMLFKASRPARLLGRSLLTGLFLSLGARTADAQILLRPDAERNFEKPVSREVEPIPSEPLQFGSTRSSASRDSEFAQLQQEAESLERQLGLVRRIVKFAAPSIVHIEASKKSDPGKGFASSRVEEAGAGVIIDMAGSQYVLTNRHVIYPAETTAILIETSDGQQMRPLKVWTDA